MLSRFVIAFFPRGKRLLVKRALGRTTTNKTSGGDGIPAELFQILKDDAVKLLHSMPANLENSAVATGLGKVSFHSNPKGSDKECSNVLVSRASKVVLKILQATLQQYVKLVHGNWQISFCLWLSQPNWIKSYFPYFLGISQQANGIKTKSQIKEHGMSVSVVRFVLLHCSSY